MNKGAYGVGSTVARIAAQRETMLGRKGQSVNKAIDNSCVTTGFSTYRLLEFHGFVMQEPGFPISRLRLTIPGSHLSGAHIQRALVGAVAIVRPRGRGGRQVGRRATAHRLLQGRSINLQRSNINQPACPGRASTGSAVAAAGSRPCSGLEFN